MDIYQAMMGTDSLDEEQMRMLAEQLRGGSGTGARLSTSSLEPIQNQGRLMQTQANQQAQQVGLMQSRKMAADQKAQSDAAKNAALSGSLGFSKPSNKATAEFEEAAGMVGTISGMANSFKDEYTADFLTGGMQEFLGKTGGMPATETMEEMGRWWSDWKAHYENIQRNKLFGSALTESEKAEWRKANINSNMKPGTVRDKLETLDRLNKKMAAYGARNAINKNWKPTYVQDVYEGIIPGEAFSSKEALDAHVKGTREDYEGSIAGAGDEPTGGSLQDMTNRELMLLLEQMGD